jgi:acetylornithine/succinyldiaminopimelate/putrescine aminotransferase
MGAVLVTEHVATAIQPGDHATTFGGGPFVSSVALHVLRRVSDPALLAKVREDGEFLRTSLGAWVGSDGVVAVRGRGLLWGIELDRPAGPMVGRALDAGLLVVTAGERVLRLVPPLVIERDDLEAGLSILRSVLS